MEVILMIPAHEIIQDEYSLVHEWRVGQLTRLGIPGAASRCSRRSRRLAPDRRVGAARLPAMAGPAHRPMSVQLASQNCGFPLKDVPGKIRWPAVPITDAASVAFEVTPVVLARTSWL